MSVTGTDLRTIINDNNLLSKIPTFYRYILYEIYKQDKNPTVSFQDWMMIVEYPNCQLSVALTTIDEYNYYMFDLKVKFPDNIEKTEKTKRIEMVGFTPTTTNHIMKNIEQLINDDN